MPDLVQTVGGLQPTRDPRTLTPEEIQSMPLELKKQFLGSDAMIPEADRLRQAAELAKQNYKQNLLASSVQNPTFAAAGGQPGATQFVPPPGQAYRPPLQYDNAALDDLQRRMEGSAGARAYLMSPEHLGIPAQQFSLPSFAAATRGEGAGYVANPEYSHALNAFNQALLYQGNPGARAVDAFNQMMAEQRLYQHGAGDIGIRQQAQDLAAQRQGYEIGGRGTWQKTLQDLQARGASQDEIERAWQLQNQYGTPGMGGAIPGFSQLGPVVAPGQNQLGGPRPSPSGCAPLPPMKVQDIIKANPGSEGMNKAISAIYSQLGPEAMLNQKASIAPALETAYGAGSLRDRVTPNWFSKGVKNTILAFGGLNPLASNNWYTQQGRSNMAYNRDIPLGESINRGTAAMPSRESEENEIIRQMLGIGYR